MGKLQRSAVFLSAAVLVAVASMTPAREAASVMFVDCGLNCYECGWFETKWEGANIDPDGYFHDRCEWGFSCHEPAGCEPINPLVTDGPPDATEILKDVTTANSAELAGVLEQHGDRVLLHATRNLVVVKGTKCDPTAPLYTSVAFVSPERTQELEDLGVTRLEQRLADF